MLFQYFASSTFTAHYVYHPSPFTPSVILEYLLSKGPTSSFNQVHWETALDIVPGVISQQQETRLRMSSLAEAASTSVSDDVTTCAICLETTGTPSFTTSCQHTFCCACLAEWIKRNASCPYCRSGISVETQRSVCSTPAPALSAAKKLIIGERTRTLMSSMMTGCTIRLMMKAAEAARAHRGACAVIGVRDIQQAVFSGFNIDASQVQAGSQPANRNNNNNHF